MVFVHPLAIKPFLKCYMAYYCEIEPVFVITQNNRFASFLVNSLRHKTGLEIPTKEYAIASSVDRIMIMIPEHYSHNYGINISFKHQFWFNKFLQDDFIDKMLATISPNLTGKKGDIRKALFKFRDKYNITEDDLPIRSLEKMWERNRERVPLYQLN